MYRSILSAPKRTVEPPLEPFGESALQTVQTWLHLNRVRIAEIPDAFSQGRTLGLMMAGATNIAGRMEQAGRPARTLVHSPKSEVHQITRKLESFGLSVDLPLDLLAGSRFEVLGQTKKLILHGACQPRLRFETLDTQSPPAWVKSLQKIQEDTGVTPIPGWILRGSDGVTKTTVAFDDEDAIAGGVSVQRICFGGTIAAMGLGLCIARRYEGKGHGRRLNASALMGALAEPGVGMALEIVSAGPSGSRNINERCGLLPVRNWCFLFGERPRDCR